MIQHQKEFHRMKTTCARNLTQSLSYWSLKKSFLRKSTTLAIVVQSAKISGARTENTLLFHLLHVCQSNFQKNQRMVRNAVLNWLNKIMRQTKKKKPSKAHRLRHLPHRRVNLKKRCLKYLFSNPKARSHLLNQVLESIHLWTKPNQATRSTPSTAKTS